MDENTKQLLLKEQDVLWFEYRALMAECILLCAKTESLTKSFTQLEYLALTSSIEFLEIAQKEQEIMTKIQNHQKAGRKRWFKYFDIEETNIKLKKYIILKRQHRDLIENALSFSIDFVNTVRQEAS